MNQKFNDPHAPDDWEAEEIAAHEAEEESVKPDRLWPVADDAVFHGRAGELVRALDPTTEADPVAVLADLLAVFGWIAGADGNAAHMMIANGKHHARVWPMIVGTTSSGAKGTSHTAVWRVASTYLKTLLTPPAHTTGLASGEGLIEAVKDDVGDMSDEKHFEPGVADKRLFVMEDEMAAVFRKASREGSTLGQTLRLAWDGRDMSTMTRRSTKATAPHIVIVGHISPGELQTVVRGSDVDGGTLNRFLFICSTRSKRLPRGGNAPQSLIDQLAQAFGESVEKARTCGLVEMTPEAWEQWSLIYYRLTADRPDTVLTKATGRRAPQVLRLAMIYTLLDGRTRISVDDLKAAVALEQFSVDSARYIFEAQSDKDSKELSKLAQFIRTAGPEGRSRNEIRTDLYQAHRKAELITRDLKMLVSQGSVFEVAVPTSGRPKMTYVAREARLRHKPLEAA